MAYNFRKTFIPIIVTLLTGILFFLLEGCTRLSNTDSPPEKMNADLLRLTSSKLTFSAEDKRGIFRLFLSENSGPPEQLRTPFNSNCITPVFSPDGKGILYAEFDGHDYELSYYDLTARAARRLTDNSFHDYAPSWSSDMKRIVWSQVPEMDLEQAHKAEIFTSEWPSFQERALTRNNRMDAYPVFNTDGNAVIVESGYVDSFFGLFKVDMKGSETPLVYYPEQSGNGIPHVYKNLIVFERAEISAPALLDIFVIDSNSPDRLSRITNWNTNCNPTPRFSPDGSLIAGHRVSEKGSQIVVVSFKNVDSAGELVFGSDVDYLKLPRWNRTGTLLAAEDVRNNSIAIFDLKGNRQNISGPGPYRGQRFMEIYNFDIH